IVRKDGTGGTSSRKPEETAGSTRPPSTRSGGGATSRRRREANPWTPITRSSSISPIPDSGWLLFDAALLSRRDMRRTPGSPGHRVPLGGPLYNDILWSRVNMPRTLFDKVWDAHVVRPETADTPAVLYVDLPLVP